MKLVNTGQSQEPEKYLEKGTGVRLAFTNFSQLPRNSVDLYLKALLYSKEKYLFQKYVQLQLTGLCLKSPIGRSLVSTVSAISLH